MKGPASYLLHRVGGRTVPWLIVYERAKWSFDHGRGGWDALTPDERRELARIIQGSHGRPSGVGERDRRRLRELLGRALKGAARPARRRAH